MPVSTVFFILDAVRPRVDNADLPGGLPGKPRGPAWVSVLGSNDQAGPLRFGSGREAFAPRRAPRVSPGYGREPVGNGHAAAGFSAGLALVVAAIDVGIADALSAG